jgi:hypothetical protein
LTCYPTTKTQTNHHQGGDCTPSTVIVLMIWDEDLLSAPDAMGTIRIPMISSGGEG